MEIFVTQQDIDLGQKGECQECPIAIALSRQIRQEILPVTLTLDLVKVFDDWLYLHFSGLEPTTTMIIPIKTTQEINQFMEDFDKGNSVLPFSFSLDYEEPLQYLDYLSV